VTFGNGRSHTITPWGFIVTVEATQRIGPDEVLEALEALAVKEEVLQIQVEALGEINVTKTEATEDARSKAN